MQDSNATYVVLYIFVELIHVHCNETFPSFLSCNMMESFFLIWFLVQKIAEVQSEFYCVF
jgi:hypothetical protein